MGNLLKPTGNLKSFGITVWVVWVGKWWASCEYQHPDNKKVEVVTTVRTARHCNTATLAIDTILTEAERLDIEFVPYLDETKPHLSLDDDEEAGDLISGDWRQLIRDEAARIGFSCRYEVALVPRSRAEPERVVADDDEDFLDM